MKDLRTQEKLLILHQKAKKFLRTARIIRDNSPVMASPHAFWAKWDRSAGEIVLNEVFLQRLSNDEREQKTVELLYHEAFHALTDERDTDARCFIQDVGDEEGAANELGSFARMKELHDARLGNKI